MIEDDDDKRDRCSGLGLIHQVNVYIDWNGLFDCIGYAEPKCVSYCAENSACSEPQPLNFYI